MRTPIEVLDGSAAHHLKAFPQGVEFFSGQYFFRLWSPGHPVPKYTTVSLYIRLRDKITAMHKQIGRKRSESSTIRYLDSVHGKVPVLRAGGETYLWMPAASGGENVWRHVLTRGTPPGSVRNRIALKAGICKNSASKSAKQLCNNSKSWVN
jgi:hypothetical protein